MRAPGYLRYRPVSFGVPRQWIAAIFGSPVYTFVREDAGIAVTQWSCGCTGVALEGHDTLDVQWCRTHEPQMPNLNYTP